MTQEEELDGVTRGKAQTYSRTPKLQPLERAKNGAPCILHRGQTVNVFPIIVLVPRFAGLKPAMDEKMQIETKSDYKLPDGSTAVRELRRLENENQIDCIEKSPVDKSDRMSSLGVHDE